MFLKTTSTLHGDDKLYLLSPFILFLAPLGRRRVFFSLLPPHCMDTTSFAFCFFFLMLPPHYTETMSKACQKNFVLPPHYMELVISFFSCCLRIAWRRQAKLVIFFVFLLPTHFTETMSKVRCFFFLLPLHCMELVISIFFVVLGTS
jgi:hypothetical protein